MSAPLALRPAWTIAHRMWLDGRWGYVSLLGAGLVVALGIRLMGIVFPANPAARMVLYMMVALAIVFTFLLGNFTEADRKERRSGFPARLFVLPVPTSILIGAPIVFGAGMGGLVYTVWARGALGGMGAAVPLALPFLYLAVGMACYHALIWSLAPYPFFRLLALSIGGTVFSVGWIPLLDHSFLAPLLGGTPVPRFLTMVFLAAGAVALAVAYLAVDAQRHGSRSARESWLRPDLITDWLPRTQRRFTSAASAQLWFEWRRHAMLLPVCTAGVLLLVILPGALAGPIRGSIAVVFMKWMLIAPIGIAFALGQAFGKADLWSKQPGLTLFLATRPWRNAEWLGAKMKAAAFAAVVAWVLVAVLVPLWLWRWCDARLLPALWSRAAELYSPPILHALPVLVFGMGVVLSWRCLVASLSIGLSGRSWMLTAATWNVFLAVCAVPPAGALLAQRPDLLRRLLDWPAWTPWLFAGLFALKLVAAAAVARVAVRRGVVGAPDVARYALIWLATTSFLLIAVWLVASVDGGKRWNWIALALFAVPLLRVAYAPIALAGNRHR